MSFKDAIARRAEVEALAEEWNDVEGARFGADTSPGTPAIILTHDPSPGAGDLMIHEKATLASTKIGRAQRGKAIFVTGGKVSAPDYAAGFVPVVVPQAFSLGNANQSIGQVSGFVAANLVQLPTAPGPIAPGPAPAPAPGPVPSGGPVGPAAGPAKLPAPPKPAEGGPSPIMIGAGILGGAALVAVGVKALGKKK